MDKNILIKTKFDCEIQIIEILEEMKNHYKNNPHNIMFDKFKNNVEIYLKQNKEIE